VIQHISQMQYRQNKRHIHWMKHDKRSALYYYIEPIIIHRLRCTRVLPPAGEKLKFKGTNLVQFYLLALSIIIRHVATSRGFDCLNSR
jgi:hypothetical protein